MNSAVSADTDFGSLLSLRAAAAGGSCETLMAMLGAKFPGAQFLITGVLGPHSNAHGPNEFLHLEYAKKLTAAVADVLAAQAGGRGAARGLAPQYTEYRLARSANSR
jgi:acetylornithine deacetylase/succinyl-diaminopimelate desuccinylase-like protein